MKLGADPVVPDPKIEAEANRDEDGFDVPRDGTDVPRDGFCDEPTVEKGGVTPADDWPRDGEKDEEGEKEGCCDDPKEKVAVG